LAIEAMMISKELLKIEYIAVNLNS